MLIKLRLCSASILLITGLCTQKVIALTAPSSVSIGQKYTVSARVNGTFGTLSRKFDNGSWEEVGSGSSGSRSIAVEQQEARDGKVYYRFNDCTVTGGRYGSSTTCNEASKTVTVSTPTPSKPKSIKVVGPYSRAEMSIVGSSSGTISGLTRYEVSTIRHTESWTTKKTYTGLPSSRPTWSINGRYGHWGGKVRACNGGNCSGYTYAPWVWKAPPKPSRPSSIQSGGDYTQHLIRFPSSSGTVTHYRLEKKCSKNSSYESISKPTKAPSSYITASARGCYGGLWTLRVKACNTDYSCSSWRYSSSIRKEPITPNLTSVKFSLTGDQIGRYSAQVSSGDVSYYEVRRKKNNGTSTLYDSPRTTSRSLSRSYVPVSEETTLLEIRACSDWNKCSAYKSTETLAFRKPGLVSLPLDVAISSDNGANRAPTGFSIDFQNVQNASRYEIWHIGKLPPRSKTGAQRPESALYKNSLASSPPYSSDQFEYVPESGILDVFVLACNRLGCSEKQSTQIAFFSLLPPKLDLPARTLDKTFSFYLKTANGIANGDAGLEGQYRLGASNYFYKIYQNKNNQGWILVQSSRLKSYGIQGEFGDSFQLRSKECAATQCSGYSNTVQTTLVDPLSLPVLNIYEYDALGRLIEHKENDLTKVSHCYDPAGNRTELKEGSDCE